jgi:predicted dehydrogenase
MAKVMAVAIGAGDRGTTAYAPYALQNPDELQIVAVVEPQKSRREKLAGIHGVPPENCFETPEEFFNKPKIGSAAIICTSDKEHYGPAKAAMEKGYHVLLEKPLSTNPARCIDLKERAEKNNVTLMTCYVLRYTPFYQKLYELVQEGKIGKLLSIQEHENVGFAHFAHSYVRGNWHNTEKSCSMILSKCCHDLDIFSWFANSPAKSIQSFGALNYFTTANAPDNAPGRCTDGCPAREECSYYAPALYAKENAGFSSAIVADGADYATRLEALKTGPYGKCVFRNDNDACDNMVTNILFENGLTVSFIINGLTYECNRHIRLYGTKGEIRGDLDRNYIEVYDFFSGGIDRIQLNSVRDRHGGGDYGIIHDFVLAVNGKGKRLTVAENSLDSHIMAFAAEESRKSGKVIEIKDYYGKVKESVSLESE